MPELKSRVRVARKYKGSSLMRMAYTSLSGNESVVVLDSVAALIVADAVLLVVPAADFLPPDVGSISTEIYRARRAMHD